MGEKKVGRVGQFGLPGKSEGGIVGRSGGLVEPADGRFMVRSGLEETNHISIAWRSGKEKTRACTMPCSAQG